MRRVITLFFSFCIVFYTNVHGQTSTLASGGEAKNEFGTVSFSIGQPFYLPSDNGSITPGVQHGYNLITILELDNTISVYPNPSTALIILRISNSNYLNYRFELYDLAGKLLISSTVQNTETIISLADIASAVYICKVFFNHSEVNIFKIIKI
jgi:hypothetical protein